VLLYRRNEHFDPARFLAEDAICWGNPSSTTDSLGIPVSSWASAR